VPAVPPPLGFAAPHRSSVAASAPVLSGFVL
jgi:hypothetical protein